MIELDLEYLHIHKKCPYLLTSVKKIHAEDYALSKALHILINFFLYKKLKDTGTSIEVFERKWNKVIPGKFKHSKKKSKFFSYFRKLYNIYKNKKLNIICIANPITFKIFDLDVKGYMDLVIKEKNKYNIHAFYFGEIDITSVPGILGHSFKSEFHRDNFILTLVNLLTGKSKKVYFNKNLNLHIQKTVRFLEKISWNVDNDKRCHGCRLKKRCKHEKI